MKVLPVVTAGLALALICTVGPVATAAPAKGKMPASTLAVRKHGSDRSENLVFIETITEDEHGKPHLCLCRAILFRMLQITARHREGGVLEVDEIKSVRTGWPSRASKEVLCEILGMPEDKLKIAPDGTKNKPPEGELPVVEKAWWEFKFSDGEVLTLWGTPKILSDDFLKLRRKHKGGDKSEAMKSALRAKKRELVDRLSRSPLNELIVTRNETP